MKMLVFVASILLIQHYNFAQEKTEVVNASQLIDINEIYQAKGVIFSESVHYFGKDALNKERFTPSIAEVRIAEKIILNSYLFNKENNNSKYSGRNVEIIMNYYRQYFGYLESDGSKIIVIYFMNVKDKPLLFQDWEKVCVVGFGDEYYKNSDIMWINITKNERILR